MPEGEVSLSTSVLSLSQVIKDDKRVGCGLFGFLMVVARETGIPRSA